VKNCPADKGRAYKNSTYEKMLDQQQPVKQSISPDFTPKAVMRAGKSGYNSWQIPGLRKQSVFALNY